MRDLVHESLPSTKELTLKEQACVISTEFDVEITARELYFLDEPMLSDEEDDLRLQWKRLGGNENEGKNL